MNTNTTITIEDLKALLMDRIETSRQATVQYSAMAQTAGFDLRAKEANQELAIYHSGQRTAYEQILSNLL